MKIKVVKNVLKANETVADANREFLDGAHLLGVNLMSSPGSGKTTLLLAVGGMLRPTMGRVIVDGNDVYAMSERKRAKFRAENIGFVFQMFHLVPYLNVVENALLPSGVGAKNHPVANKTDTMELLKNLRMVQAF